MGNETPTPSAQDLAAKYGYDELKKINSEINRGPYKDCEWFTFFKMQKLKEMGIPADKLYVATETTDGSAPNHVVASVGDWILDNRHPRPYTRKDMEKRYKVFPGYETVPGTSKFSGG